MPNQKKPLLKSLHLTPQMDQAAEQKKTRSTDRGAEKGKKTKNWEINIEKK